MAADRTVIGLTLAKIDNVFHVDVKNARWSDKRANVQHVTGGGVRQATGAELPSGSFDEVIPRDAAFDWRTKRNFSVEIFDQETQSILLAAFTECNWVNLDGSADNGSANATKAIGWNGSQVVKI